MEEYQSAPYIITRGGSSRGGRNGGGGGRPMRGAAILISALLLFTAAICLLVYFLPRPQDGDTVSAPQYSGKTFYFLVSGESDNYTTALARATDSSGRGGAGYLFNDGTFRVLAAAYEKESDVKTLVAVNDGSSYIALELRVSDLCDVDRCVIEHLTGEWFAAINTASIELDRGTISEAAADYAARLACRRLLSVADAAESPALKRAIERACDYDYKDGGTRTLLAYLRFVAVRGLVEVYEATA